MGFVPVGLAILAAALSYRLSDTLEMWAAIIAAAGGLASYGIMHNFAVEAAKRRPGYRGGFSDFTEAEADAAPNWISIVNFAFSVLSLILLIIAAIRSF